jgi:hypothetical protein
LKPLLVCFDLEKEEEGMSRFNGMRYWLIVLIVLSHFFLSACAGVPDIPDSEKKYAEGVVVEGGVFGLRIKIDSGEVLRIIVKDHTIFDPVDFHAFFGDKVGVTYYTTYKDENPRHEALALKLLETSPERIDFSSGSIEGIIRASGMMRYLVHIPEKNLTLAFYKPGYESRLPKDWSPETGNRVKVLYSVEAKRFHKRLVCKQIHRLEEDPVPIEDNTANGVVTQLLTERRIRMIPLRFLFQTEGGEPLKIYTGGETQASPVNTELNVGTECALRYYDLLLGDQSRRRVAVSITW